MIVRILIHHHEGLAPMAQVTGGDGLGGKFRGVQGQEEGLRQGKHTAQMYSIYGSGTTPLNADRLMLVYAKVLAIRE